MEMMELKVEDRLEIIELLEKYNEIFYCGEVWKSEEWDTDRYLMLQNRWNKRIFIEEVG